MRSRHLVDPELLPAVDDGPQVVFSLETLPNVRAMVADFAQNYQRPTDDGISLEIKEVPGEAGDPDVRVLCYRPENTDPSTALPAIIYIHGGGFFSGKADYYEDWCRVLVGTLNAVVIAVDYRKAPETPHPGPINDCYAVLRWMHENASELGIDANRIAVEGVSAGGGLAASLALLARDRGEFGLSFQLLDYPMLDDRTGRDGAYRDPFNGEYIWTYDGNAFGWETLLGDNVGTADVTSYAAPARAEALDGLPPAFIGVGALDPLMRESVDYAVRLIAAGVPVRLAVYPGAYHGFDAFDGGQSAVGTEFRTARLAALKSGLECE